MLLKTRPILLLSILALLVTSASYAGAQPIASNQKIAKKDRPNGGMMYTTYFYTATEAIIHGYEKNTEVRIVSLKGGRTIWKGTVGPGETKTVKTGRGVFGFLATKKASILVGTPTTCNVVGYWFRNQDGSFLSKQFFGKLPSATTNKDERVIVWAWDNVNVQVTDTTNDSTIFSGKLKAGQYFELTGQQLAARLGHTLDVRGDKKALSVQVYFDEGFFVPSTDGRASGKLFRSYVGGITEGVNDLNLFSYHANANVTVVDMKTKKPIWKGVLKPETVKTLTLSKKFVEIRSDIEISALVAPYEHYQSGYAEHHFGGGAEGTGIENQFYMTTPSELWVFSYFNNNDVEVIDMKTKKSVWKGMLKAGHVHGIHPGHGFFKIKSSAGVSVMGGDQACGAEFSPAGGLFRVDEELLKVTEQIVADRVRAARKQGKTLSKKQKYAPLSAPEKKRAKQHIKSTMGRSMSDEEVDARYEAVTAE